MANPSFDHTLDIRTEVCPMTFVKTRLLVEQMQAGDSAQLLIGSEEARSNLPEALKDLGCTVTTVQPYRKSNLELSQHDIITTSDCNNIYEMIFHKTSS
jgi:TusA-related sulfurtransferase